MLNKEMIKKEIEKNAADEGISVIEMITAMQGIVTKNKDFDILENLIEIKRDYI